MSEQETPDVATDEQPDALLVGVTVRGMAPHYAASYPELLRAQVDAGLEALAARVAEQGLTPLGNPCIAIVFEQMAIEQ